MLISGRGELVQTAKEGDGQDHYGGVLNAGISVTPGTEVAG